MTPKILVVDDSQTARQFVRDALSGYRCELLEAEDARTGLELSHCSMPDLILLDIGLEGMDGCEMLSRIRSDPALRKIRVIAFTAQATRSSVLKMAHLGVCDYLLKPLTDQVLRDRIHRVVPLRPLDVPDPPARRFEDPLKLLVIEDKTGIHQVLSEGLAATGWELIFHTGKAEAMEFCKQQSPDVVLMSTTLPDGGSVGLAKALRTVLEGRGAPVIALGLERTDSTAAFIDEEFDGSCTKPINCEELQSELCRVLKLDRTARFIEDRKGIFYVSCPQGTDLALAEELFRVIPGKLAAAIDAGTTKAAISLEKAKKTEPKLLRFVVAVKKLCEEAKLETVLIAPQAVIAQCCRYEDAKTWTFYSTFEELVAPAPAEAAA